MAVCLKGKAMVMVPSVFPRGYLNSERLGEEQEQTCLQWSSNVCRCLDSLKLL